MQIRGRIITIGHCDQPFLQGRSVRIWRLWYYMCHPHKFQERPTDMHQQPVLFRGLTVDARGRTTVPLRVSQRESSSVSVVESLSPVRLRSVSFFSAPTRWTGTSGRTGRGGTHVYWTPVICTSVWKVEKGLKFQVTFFNDTRSQSILRLYHNSYQIQIRTEDTKTNSDRFLKFGPDYFVDEPNYLISI